MPENKFSRSVDSILENLKQQQPDRAASDREVDDILADLGLDSGVGATPMGMQQNSSRQQQSQAFRNSAEQTQDAGKRLKPKERIAPKKPAAKPKPKNAAQPAPQVHRQPAPQVHRQPAPQVHREEQEEIRAPRLSDTIQMDSEFQKFFSESVAVIPDLEQEQHPGFFARFVRRKKNDAEDLIDEEDEGLYAQDSYEQQLDVEEQETEPLPQEEPVEDVQIEYEQEPEEVQIEYPEEEAEETWDQPLQIEPEPVPEKPRKEKHRVQPERDTVSPEAEQTAEYAPAQARVKPQKEISDEPGQTREIPLQDDVGAVSIPLPEEESQDFTGSVSLNVDWMDQEEQEATRMMDAQSTGHSGLPRLRGDEKTGEPVFEEPIVEEYLDDYETPGDAPVIQTELDKLRITTSIRSVVAGMMSIVLLYLGIAVGESPLPAIGPIDPATAPMAFLAVNFALLLVACAVNWRVFVNGIKGLWSTPSPDTIPALASIASALQLVVLMVGAKNFEADKVTLFAAPAALLLCFNAIGKYLSSGVISRNFEMTSAGNEHVAAFKVADQQVTDTLAEGLGEPQPGLLASRPTNLVKGFMRRSFSVRKSDYLIQKMSWVLAGVAVLTALITLFTKQGISMAFTVLAGTLCLGGPVAATLLSAVPGMLMQKSASRVGAVIPGWPSVEELSSANMIVVSAKDLFPAKSVRLHGIKTFGKERIDLAILYAASVLIEGCDTLRDVFMNIIQSQTKILFPVENLENDPGYGFTAWVQNKRIIIGNRAMMEKQGVEIPSLDYENRYTKGTKQPIYLAVSGQIFGMFLVSYKANPEAAEILESLRHQGISVLLKSDDFSLNDELVAQVYDLPEGCIKVLSASERHTLAPMVEYRQSSEGCMGHLGSFVSFVGGLLAACGAASAERTSSLVQAAGIIVSALLALLLAFTGGTAALALPALILYQAAWAVLTLMIPMIKRY